MSTVVEIAEALASLNDEELRQVERALISIYRQRKTGIIFDDAYGVWTEEEQASAAAQVFALMDAAEEKVKQSLQS
ncbi:MAG: hypothetical protein ACK45B_09720 [Limisphaerales bacterium]